MPKSKRQTRQGFGALRQLPSGRYQASYLAPDGSGRRLTAPRTFVAKIDAQAWLFDRRKELDGQTWVSPEVESRRRERFGSYAAEWITHRRVKGAPLRPRTVEEYRRLLAGPLEQFADAPLDQITRDSIDAWHRKHASERVTQTSRAYALLKAVLTDAVDRGHLPVNPAKVRGGASASTGRKVTPPTSAEVGTIREALPQHLRALVTIAASGGLRYGEATELRRRDISIRPSGVVIVRVERAASWISTGVVIGPPKSAAGTRSVALPSAASAEVVTHLATHVGRSKDALLFPDAAGGNLASWKFAPAWRKARAAAERPDLGFHALRHYHLTAFAAQPGATLVNVMARAGHVSAIAALAYQHAAQSVDEEIASRM